MVCTFRKGNYISLSPPYKIDTVVTVCSDIFHIEKRRYVLVSPHDTNTLNSIESELAKKLSADVRLFDDNNAVLLKLPYRYNKYEIQWKGLANSLSFTKGNTLHIGISLVGLLVADEVMTPCFKCESVAII